MQCTTSVIDALTLEVVLESQVRNCGMWRGSGRRMNARARVCVCAGSEWVVGVCEAARIEDEGFDIYFSCQR